MDLKNPATTPEPAPTRTASPAVWPLIIGEFPGTPVEAPEWLRQVVTEDMRARDEFGRAKHGMPLQVENGREPAHDAYQEALDLCAYTRQKAAQSGLHIWWTMHWDALRMVVAIRYQMALEAKGEG